MSIQRLIELFRGESVSMGLAHQKVLKAAQLRTLFREQIKFVQAMEKLSDDAIIFGIHKELGRETPVRVPIENLRGHQVIQGRSGSGKSRYAEFLIMQLLQSCPDAGKIVIDGKGELFQRVQRLIAALLFRKDDRGRDEFLKRVDVIDPFHPRIIPPLNFCIPGSSYPAEILAEDILGALRRLFSSDRLTIRMEVALRHTLIALIQAGTCDHPLSLLDARELLMDAAFRERVLLRIENEETLNYFRRDFPRESQNTIEAIKGRLSYLLLSDNVRLCLGANHSLQLRDAIEEGKILLINLGKTRFATDKAREVMGTLLLSSFIRGVFSRPMNHGPNLFCFMDEFQNFIVPEIFEILFTEGRAYRCFATVICQQMGAQLASSALRQIILNNVRYISLFSSNDEDVRLLGRVMFRPTGHLPKPTNIYSDSKQPRFYTESEEIEHLIRRTPSLEKRKFHFWDKESPFGAQILSTVTVAEPHEYAGIKKAEFERFFEGLEPLWNRLGQEKGAAKKMLEEKRKVWGLGLHKRGIPPDNFKQSRRDILRKLAEHLGQSDKGDKMTR
jgi:uncharacterized protein DUF87